MGHFWGPIFGHFFDDFVDFWSLLLDFVRVYETVSQEVSFWEPKNEPQKRTEFTG